MKKIKVILILMLGLGFFLHLDSQEIYRTKNATIAVTCVVSDTVLIVQSKKLVLFLEEETAEFSLKVDKSTFYTGNPAIDSLFQSRPLDFVEFNGKIDLNFIHLEDHPPQDFEIEGRMKGQSNLIRGTGRIEFLDDGGSFSNVITMRFNIKLAELGFNFPGFDIHENIQIEILQAVLSRDL